MAANLGKIVPKPKNKWVIGLEYKYLDIVTHNGNSYIAMRDNAVEPSDDGVNWQLLVEGVPIATEETLGKVKPDGTTITIQGGVITAVKQVPDNALVAADKESSGGIEEKNIIAVYTDSDGNTYKGIIETKESCITDDAGVSLDTKLANMQTQIDNVGGNVVGDMTDLITNNKETLVGAINEVQNGTVSINNDLQNGYPTQILIKDGSDTDKLFALRCYPESWGAGASIGIENLDMTWYKRLQIQEDNTLHFVIKDEGSEDVRDMRLMTSENVINTNLLINSDFRNPINQRGQTEYTGNNIYTVDRWRTGGGGVNGKIIINDGYVTIKRTAASLYLSFFQRIAAEEASHLSNRTVTLSAKVRTSSNNFRIAITVNNGTELNYDTFDGTGDWQIITKTVNVPQIDSYINFGLSNNPIASVGDSCDIEWIKLEAGSVATPFVSPDPATELVKCQRYYEKGECTYSNSLQSGLLDYVQGVNFKVTKRVPPTVKISSNNTSGKVADAFGNEYSVLDIFRSEYGIRNLRISASMNSSISVLYSFEADAEIY